MLACVFEGKEQWVVKEVDPPDLGEDEVLVQVKAAGICGTDIHILRAEYFQDFPIIAGHEFSGQIVEVGRKVSQFKMGDRVTADPNIFCDRCYFCKINKNNHCLNAQAVGVTRSGAFAELVAVPEKCIFPIPENLTFAEAALAEPLACVVYGAKRSGIQPGEKVLIFGAGPIGLLLLALYKVYGASQIVVVDVSEKKLAKAKEWGADLVVLADGTEDKLIREISPLGFELVVDATGIPRVQENELQFIQPDGTYLLFGVAPVGSQMTIDPYFIFRNDVRILGSYAVKKTMQYAINLLTQGKIPVKELVSASYPLPQFGQALQEVLHNPDRLKIQIHFA